MPLKQTLSTILDNLDYLYATHLQRCFFCIGDSAYVHTCRGGAVRDVKSDKKTTKRATYILSNEQTMYDRFRRLLSIT
jgi:hypothetical protein